MGATWQPGVTSPLLKQIPAPARQGLPGTGGQPCVSTAEGPRISSPPRQRGPPHLLAEWVKGTRLTVS